MKPTTSRIMFFSRGKGRGHAVPDAEIASEIRRREPEAEIIFISYGLGARTLRDLGWDVVDLGLPEDNPFWETAGCVSRVLLEGQPGLAVSHEEFIVGPVANALGIPSILLTDWFPNQSGLHMDALRFVDEVVFLDEPGYDDLPAHLTNQISYVGPVLRTRRAAALTKPQCRARLGVRQDDFIVLVVPGGAAHHSEEQAPICDVVLAAFDLLEHERKRLIWVADGADYDGLVERALGRDEVLVVRPHQTVDVTMKAADVVITKGNRITVLEAEALGIPSLSISFGNNPIDDHRVARVRTNAALRGRGLTASLLSKKLVDCVRSGAAPASPAPRDTITETPAERAAARILEKFRQTNANGVYSKPALSPE